MKKIIWITLFLLCLSLASALEAEIHDPIDLIDDLAIQNMVRFSTYPGKIILKTALKFEEKDFEAEYESLKKETTCVAFILYEKEGDNLHVIVNCPKLVEKADSIEDFLRNFDVAPYYEMKIELVVGEMVRLLEGKEIQVEEETKEIPVEENKKDMSKYTDKTVFIISDKDISNQWDEILQYITVTIWAKKNETCNTVEFSHLKTTPKCAYPYLIYHEEDTGIDADSIVHFLNQYKPDRVYLLGEPDERISKLVASAVDPSKIKIKPFSDYFSFWQEKGEIVVSEKSYETGLIAAQYASYINAPLVFEGEYDPDVVKGRYIIPIGQVNTNKIEKQGPMSVEKGMDIKETIWRMHLLHNLSFDKVILTNPNDILEDDSSFEMIGVNFNFPNRHYEDILFDTLAGKTYKQYYENSLIAPYLAVAKDQLIIQTPPETDAYSFSTEKLTSEREIVSDNQDNIYILVHNKLFKFDKNNKFSKTIDIPRGHKLSINYNNNQMYVTNLRTGTIYQLVDEKVVNQFQINFSDYKILSIKIDKDNFIYFLIYNTGNSSVDPDARILVLDNQGKQIRDSGNIFQKEQIKDIDLVAIQPYFDIDENNNLHLLFDIGQEPRRIIFFKYDEHFKRITPLTEFTCHSFGENVSSILDQYKLSHDYMLRDIIDDFLDQKTDFEQFKQDIDDHAQEKKNNNINLIIQEVIKLNELINQEKFCWPFKNDLIKNPPLSLLGENKLFIPTLANIYFIELSTNSTEKLISKKDGEEIKSVIKNKAGDYILTVGEDLQLDIYSSDFKFLRSVESYKSENWEDILKEKIEKLKKDFQKEYKFITGEDPSKVSFFTVVGSPRSIYYSYMMGGEKIFNLIKRTSADRFYFDFNNDGIEDSPFGRISGNLPDVSTLVVRSVFIDQVMDSQMKFLGVSKASASNDNALFNLVYTINKEPGVQAECFIGNSFFQIANTCSLGEVPDKKYKENNIILFRDHGNFASWPPELYSTEIPQLNSAVGIGSACSTSDYYPSLSYQDYQPFSQAWLRKGGIAYIGSVTTIYVDQERLFTPFLINRLGSKTLGEAVRDSVYLTGTKCGSYIQMILLSDPTIKLPYTYDSNQLSAFVGINQKFYEDGKPELIVDMCPNQTLEIYVILDKGSSVEHATMSLLPSDKNKKTIMAELMEKDKQAKEKLEDDIGLKTPLRIEKYIYKTKDLDKGEYTAKALISQSQGQAELIIFKPFDVGDWSWCQGEIT